MIHELKISKPFFQQVIDGNKTFEIRNNIDKGFQKGDTVILREIKNGIATDNFTGRSQLVEISYVSDFNQPANQVVFAMVLIGDVIGE